jgi:hypothetical protein
MTLNFAPGETNVVADKFSPSVVLFWLRSEIGASSTRIVIREPNTVLGVIPLGSQDRAFPLSNVASVGVNSRFSIARLVFGLLSLLVGFNLSGVLMLVLILWGLSLLANTMSATLAIQNNGGGIATVEVSILEKGKLAAIGEAVNERLFADHGLLRHNETMQVQNAQLYTQQQQLNAQIMGQQAAMLQNQQSDPHLNGQRHGQPASPEPTQQF